jgi:hypothetical protein
MALYRDGPSAKTIQLLVHMLPGDQCTRFTISKMTTIKACPTFRTRRMHSLSLLATENATEATSAFAWPMSAEQHLTRSTNGRSPRVAGPLDHGKLRHD